MSDIESFSGSESETEVASEMESTLETLIYGKSLEEACSINYTCFYILWDKF